MILKTHTKLDWINLSGSLTAPGWMDLLAGQKSPGLGEMWALSQAVASENRSPGSRTPGLAPRAVAPWQPPPQDRHQGRWGFQLLRPHPITRCCKNHPDFLVLLELCSWLKCQGGHWPGFDIFVIHVSCVAHGRARERDGACMDPDHLGSNPSSHFTSCVTWGKFLSFLVSLFSSVKEGE